MTDSDPVVSPSGCVADAAETAPLAFPDNPVLAAVTRGELIETFHRGAAAVLTADGSVALAWGDIDRLVFPRSAIKPMQALALLEALPDAPDLTAERVALHTASHGGWPMHVTAIRAWLAQMGLSEQDLECGAGDWPLDATAARALARDGGAPTPAHHNCAGQHAGFLRLARHLGGPTRGYVEAAHPVQQAVMAVLSDLCEVEACEAPAGLEGCGIPSLALPLWAVALGTARLADPAGLAPARRAAVLRLRAAMTAHPDLIAGPGRCDTRVAQVTQGRILTKIGADGAIVAMVPEQGLGVAVKVDSGAGQAAEVALGLVLQRLGVVSEDELVALAAVFQPRLTTAAGRAAGRVLPVLPAEEMNDTVGDDGDEGGAVDPWDEDWDDDA